MKEAVKGGYAKACVQVDISKPLYPRVDIIAKGRRKWREFKYENIPRLCHLCGRVGHLKDECHHISKAKTKRLKKENDRLFGLWMMVYQGLWLPVMP